MAVNGVFGGYGVWVGEIRLQGIAGSCFLFCSCFLCVPKEEDVWMLRLRIWVGRRVL